MLDSYLRRKTYLERYIKGLTKSQLDSLKAGDKELITTVRDYLDDANGKELDALLKDDKSNSRYAELAGAITGILATQSKDMRKSLKTEIRGLMRSEINFNYEMFKASKDTPDIKELMKLPVAGYGLAQTVNLMQQRIATRIRGEIVQAVQNNTDPVPILRGDRNQRYRNGVFFWRDNRIISPELHRLITGMNWNARKGAIDAIEPDTPYRWTGVLDGRQCLICATNDTKSPYAADDVPPFPAHPRCRCEVLPDILAEGERPFVADNRPVKDIPKDERDDKIGTVSGKTKYAQWFSRQSAEYQREWLGPSRYELYKSGKYKMTDFVDPRTNKIYTLEQLDLLR